MFASGISDETFQNILDHYTDYTLDELKLKLTNKARKEKIYNGYAGESRRSNKKQRSDTKKKGKGKDTRRQNKKETNQSKTKSNEGGPPAGSGFSSKAWKEMSPENKK